MQNESQEIFIFIAEPQPILSKDSSRRAQCKMKVKKLSFSLLSRSLSYESCGENCKLYLFLKIIAPTHFVTRDQKVSFNQIEYRG